MKKLINCISNPGDFNREEYEKLGIGLEIQDFAKSKLLDGKWKERLDDYKVLLKGFTNELILHGPFIDLQPVSPDGRIRELSQKRYRHMLRIAKELSADCIIFHSQINPWIREPLTMEWIYGENKKFWQQDLKDIGYKGEILIENIFENKPRLIKDLVDTINLPNVKICLDIGHILLVENKSIEDWLEELNERVAYIHLHWNNGAYDQHAKPSNANIDYLRKLLDKHRLNPTIAMEYRVRDLTAEVERIKKG